jgi:hypothetical protein
MTGQLPLAATQRWFTQHPPPQPFASQHAWPGPPHWAHTPAPQTKPLPHDRPAQHASPADPHVAQTLPLHTKPLAQVAPGQHPCPGAPHAPPPFIPEFPQQMIAIIPTIAKPRIQMRTRMAHSLVPTLGQSAYLSANCRVHGVLSPPCLLPASITLATAPTIRR